MALSLLGISLVYYNISHNSLWRISHELTNIKLKDAVDITSNNLEVLHRFGLDKIPANIKKAQDESAKNLSDIHFGKSGYVFVVNKQGIVLAHPDPGLLGHQIDARTLNILLNVNNKADIEFTLLKNDRIGSVSHFKPWNWYLVCSLSQTEVLGTVNYLLVFTLWATLGIFILISTVLLFVIRGITKPISELTIAAATAAATAAAAGSAKVKKVMTTSNDEIGILTTTFTQMQIAIQEQFAKICKSEEKHRRLIENLGREYFFYAHNTDGVFSYVSPSITEMLGYEQDEFKTHYATYLTDNDINDDVIKRTEECINGGKSAPYLLEIFHKSGDRYWLEINETPIFDTDGKVVAIEGIAHDITERKHAEEELRLLRNYLSNIIDSMPSVLVGVNIDGKVNLWNKTAIQSTGIDASTAQGKMLSDVFPQMASEMGNIIARIQNREVKQELKRLRQSEHGNLYEDVTIYPLITNGVEGAVIRIDDVTDKVLMEEMMIQSEKMLSIGGLAAGIAHEINNPLAGMVQTANVMADRLGNKLDMPASIEAAENAGTSIEAIQNFIETRGIFNMTTNIIESGIRISNIVKNMLSFARKSDSEASPYAIIELIDKTIELAITDYDLKKHYDFKAIDIKKEYEESLPLVPCECAKIQQVILNILRNGAHAMQEAETLNPMIIIRVYVEKEQQMICIEIEDNGPGMAEAICKRVFEPFFTTKATGDGIGLGLSVSYFIITENHKGDMTVESKPGSGTKFIIHLPLWEKKA